jgi:alpha-L-rhamnosidase
MLLDSQRPNGAVPCIAPCTPEFGFFWGSGPAWDAALFEIPWQIYRFYGDDAPAREAYGAMKRYLAFILEKADADGLVGYGLGDWCTPGLYYTVPVKLTDSAYIYQFCRRLAFWAERFGEHVYAADCTARAEDIRTAINKAFHKGDGLYAAGEATSLAAPLYFEGLAADGMERRIAERLVDVIRANGHKACFGILGAKWVPRVLAKYGYADDAWKLFVQPEFPGWANWLKSGDGCLWEDWDGARSRNHVMFGDYSAWAYEYAAGIVPLEPGFRKVAFRPHFISGVESFGAVHKTPYGEIRASWRRENGKPVFTYSVPEGVEVVPPRTMP